MEKPLIEDTYADSKMKHFLYGDHLHDYQLFVTCAVLLHYNRRANNNKARINENTEEYRKKFDNAINKSKTIHDMLHNLQEEFKCKSLECIYANALLAYNGDINELLIRSLNFSGRVLKLNSRSDWLDNWRINAFGTCLSTIMWREYDNRACFTVKRNYKPINRNVDIDYESFATYCVGILREFIIRLGVYPNMPVPTHLKTIMNKLESDRFKNMSVKAICDECYKHFVYSYIGSHGCNALIDGKDSNKQWTCTIREIKTFLKRYPAMLFGGVFNTSPYGQAGQHWVSVMFHNKQHNGKYEIKSNMQEHKNMSDDDNLISSAVQGSSLESFDIEDHYANYSNGNLDEQIDNGMSNATATGLSANAASNSVNKVLAPEAILFCSQGSGWDSFVLHEPILSQLREGESMPTAYNQESLQVDGFSCGNFSIVSNFIMICNNMDMHKTAKDIGKNGTNLGALVGKEGKIDIYTMRKSLFGVT